MNSIEAKKEIIRVAKEMLAGAVDLIIGCRVITGLSCNTDDPQDEIYLPFIALDSETDHLPMGSVRELCDPDYLKRVDKEINRYNELAREDIHKACVELVKKLSHELEDTIDSM